MVRHLLAGHADRRVAHPLVFSVLLALLASQEASAAQLAQAGAPLPGSGAAGTTRFVPPASGSGPVCAPGADTQTVVVSAMFPAPPDPNSPDDCGGILCDDLAELPWGNGGPFAGAFPGSYWIELPRFNRLDYSGAVLQSAELEYTIDLSGWYGAENLGQTTYGEDELNDAITFNAVLLGDSPELAVSTLFAPAIQDLLAGTPALEAFDDTVDYLGPSGFTLPLALNSGGDGPTLVLDEWWVNGDPGDDLGVSVELNSGGSGYVFNTGGFNLALFGVSRGKVTVDITYTYCINQGPYCCPGDAQSCDCQGPWLVPEDSGVGVLADVLDCVEDPEKDEIAGGTLIVTTPPMHGTAIPTQDPSLVSAKNPDGWGVLYTPTTLNYCGPDEFYFSVADEWGNVSPEPCLVRVQVTPVNDPPTAVNDPDPSSGIPCYTKRNDGLTPILLPVCDNDFDIDEANACGAGLDCSSVFVTAFNPVFDPPYSGGYTLVASASQAGSIELLLDDPFYCGELTFRYRVRDFDGATSNPATVQVCLFTNNNPPVANPDDFCSNPILEDTPFVDLPVVANDTDPDAFPCGFEIDPCQLEITAQPTVGTVQTCGQNPDIPSGNIRYFPPADYCGDNITFSYRVSDGDLWSNSAVVTLCIDGANDAPVAVDDVETTEVDIPVTIDVVQNDFDPDSLFTPPCGFPLDPTSVQITTPPTCEGGAGPATATVLPSGEVQFTPPPGFIGVCTFGYKVSDTNPNSPRVSNEATVTVHIEQTCFEISRRRGASLLLFPQYDNREGQVTILTVTNTSFMDSVRTEFTYRDGETCMPFTRRENLTPNDTISVLTGVHYATEGQGYVTVAAMCDESSERIVFNHLIGNELVMDGFEGAFYSLNPVDFRGLGMDADGVPGGQAECGFPLTDLDGDGLLDLDGMEYDPLPDELLIPRFFGQNEERSSDLILIDFTGRQFETRVNFLVYNDNEQVFSTQHQFSCWDRVGLTTISDLFTQTYLAGSTNQDPEEVLGDPSIETGWFRLNGDTAQSSNGTEVEDPAIYAVLIDFWNPDHLMSALPFERCSQDNGALLSNSLNGDQD